MQRQTPPELREAVAELRDALEPFASVSFPPWWPDDKPAATSLVSVGEFRRAANALTKADAILCRIGFGIPGASSTASGEPVANLEDPSGRPASPCSQDWSDHLDDIADTISDSIDMDWRPIDGARAVVEYLNAQASPCSQEGG